MDGATYEKIVAEDGLDVENPRSKKPVFLKSEKFSSSLFQELN